jgi:hypothetical protein
VVAYILVLEDEQEGFDAKTVIVDDIGATLNDKIREAWPDGPQVEFKLVRSLDKLLHEMNTGYMLFLVDVDFCDENGLDLISAWCNKHRVRRPCIVMSGAELVTLSKAKAAYHSRQHLFRHFIKKDQNFTERMVDAIFKELKGNTTNEPVIIRGEFRYLAKKYHVNDADYYLKKNKVVDPNLEMARKTGAYDQDEGRISDNPTPERILADWEKEAARKKPDESLITIFRNALERALKSLSNLKGI